MEKTWVVADTISETVLAKYAQHHPVVAQLLHNRELVDVEAIDRFLHPDYARDVHDPFLFTQMQSAVDRVFMAIDADEQITVHGDYDADGVCGSAVLCSTLEAIGAKVDFFLPHREKDGYGLNAQTVTTLFERGTKVIITTDCGISNTEEVAQANDLGIDVIITDHHQVPDLPPAAHATLHPKLPGETYPDKTLSGGGVAFKFCQALLQTHKKTGNETVAGIKHEAFEKWLLDLVAISSVADMVPLRDETRALTRYGLIVLNKTRRLGLQKLLATGHKGRNADAPLDATSIGFRIAPRINAAGRMEHAQIALNLLLAKENAAAETLAQNLHQHNLDRQKLTERLTREAHKLVKEHHGDSDPILFVRGDGWSPGIIGLIASRLKDKYYRPVIVLGEGHGTYVGSGRSIPQFHITQALQEASHVFAKFGGHPQACGFSLKSKDIYEEFTHVMTAIAGRELENKNLTPLLDIEAQLTIEQVDWDLWNTLERFAPFGIGNPEPKFLAKNIQIIDIQSLGATGKHMRLLGKHPESEKVQKFIAFFCSAWLEEFKVRDIVDIVFELGINEWNGRKELQLKIVDIRKI